MTEFAKKAPDHRDELKGLKEILLANVVMASEIPSPTGDESELVSFLNDRFTESGLNNISVDEAGNVAAVANGSSKSDKNILVAAHLDKIWTKSDDHTIAVLTNTITGRGIADNSLGVAVLASLPMILEKLEISFDSNLILLGTTKSFGRGDLGGMRFFLDNTQRSIDTGLCIEGIELGRLSYSSLGMVRGDISINLTTDSNWPWQGAGAITQLNQIIDRIMSIQRPEKPRTSILLGSVRAGSGYSVPPKSGNLSFEIRSESEEIVDGIYNEIREIVNETNAQCDQCDVSLVVFARRYPGAIDFKHPLVKAARSVMDELNIKPRIAPSISDLSALLDRGIPGLTLGITTGENRSTPEESIDIEPIFSGIAQVISTLQFIDDSLKTT